MKTHTIGQSESVMRGSVSLFSFMSITSHTSRMSRLCLAALLNYKKNRENGSDLDNPNSPFPSAGFDQLHIKNSEAQVDKWPDFQGRYWWKLTLESGKINYDFYWKEDSVRGWPDKSNKHRYWFYVGHVNGTKIEGFSQEPDYYNGVFDFYNKNSWYFIQFDDVYYPPARQWMEEKDFNYLNRIRIDKPAFCNYELANLRDINPKHPAISKFEVIAEAQRLMSQQQNPTKPKKLLTPIHEEKQKMENSPSLHNDIIKQSNLHIKYEEIDIVKKLGEGAFGVVFHGKWKHENVAVKKLHLQQMSENALMEFKEEAAIMQRLQSDYVVFLKGICLTPYTLVMEYMRGGTLFNLLHSKILLTLSTRQSIALDIAKGLAFLHNHNPPILHRDLKSHNVLLNENQRAKLADFGLARVRVEFSRSQTHAQSPNKSVGTIPWMAPECFGIRPKYSEKSDMYAYGMVLWELISRKMPYEDVTDPTEIRDAVKAGDREEIPDKITNPNDVVPVPVKELIKFCWFNTPETRPEAIEAITTIEKVQTLQFQEQSTSGNSLSC